MNIYDRFIRGEDIMKKGWWKLVYTGTNDDNDITELNNADKEHIAKLIVEGYTEGEIIQED